MDDNTSIVLALQLLALCCIACALLLYLLRRIRPQTASLQTKEVGVIMSFIRISGGNLAKKKCATPIQIFKKM